mmetsp:Transcript_23809/g.81795  ORF Transcript_23809/g.81795 Transcript_23809/m.81795 type:complete len:380 (-) Transcript_23809:56-1195(-)
MASASNTANMSARDRAKQRELAEARQNGQAAPEVDVNSGAMINPHNPDFITKRPWYLGDSGPSLQHHDTRGAATASEVSMAEADAHLRRRRGAWEARVGGGAVAVVEVGAWIEALYRGKTPWLPARVAKVRLDGSLDLEFENGRTSQKVPRAHAKLPKAGAGARSGLESLGKVAYDAKRDRWHGYDPSMHKETEDRYAELDAARARRKDKRQDARSKEARAAAKAERKQAKAAEKAAGGGDDDDDSDSDSDSDDESSDGLSPEDPLGLLRRFESGSKHSLSDLDEDSANELSTTPPNLGSFGGRAKLKKRVTSKDSLQSNEDAEKPAAPRPADDDDLDDVPDAGPVFADDLDDELGRLSLRRARRGADEDKRRPGSSRA